MGCPLALNAAVVISKRGSKRIVPLALVSKATPVAAVSVAQKAPLASALRLPNRGHTYLRFSVFLI